MPLFSNLAALRRSDRRQLWGLIAWCAGAVLLVVNFSCSPSKSPHRSVAAGAPIDVEALPSLESRHWRGKELADGVEFRGARLVLPPDLVEAGVEVTAAEIEASHLPPLAPGMMNVTRRGGGFRISLSEPRLTAAARLSLPVDEARVPASVLRVLNVANYRWDAELGRWLRLPSEEEAAAELGRVSISTLSAPGITIAAVLEAPEQTKPTVFDPNALNDIAAALPHAGVDLIEPPQVNNQGEARLSFPLRLPAGRGAYSPTLAITYNSSSGNGPLGVGWSLGASRIEVDTRQGVPPYNGTERLLLDGEELLVASPAGGATPGSDCILLAELKERVDQHRRILKCRRGNQVSFEVIHKNGVRFEYGVDAQSRLASYASGEGDHVAQWMLRRVTDPNGNITTYEYCRDGTLAGSVVPCDTQLNAPDVLGEPFEHRYLKSIHYTQHPGEGLASTYEVSLSWDCRNRPDPVVSGRMGFKVVTRCRLQGADIVFRPDASSSKPIRSYRLEYWDEHPTQGAKFVKSLLRLIEVQDAYGKAQYSHRFDYRELDLAAAFPKVTTWQPSGPGRLGMSLTRNEDNLTRINNETHNFSQSGGFSFGLAVGDLGASCYIGGATGLDFESPVHELALTDLNGDGVADRPWSLFGSFGGRHALVSLSQQGEAQGLTYVDFPAGLIGTNSIGHDEGGGLSQSGQFSCQAMGASAGLSHSLQRPVLQGQHAPG